jgi:hypothetical protein
MNQGRRIVAGRDLLRGAITPPFRDKHAIIFNNRKLYLKRRKRLLTTDPAKPARFGRESVIG